MRSRTSVRKADETENQVHRLTDITVKEVSLVDRAANKKTFLVVKNEGATSVEKAPGETPAPQTALEAQPAETPPEPLPEPTLKLSAENKTIILERCSKAIAALQALSSRVEKAEEVAGLLDVPQEIVDVVNELVVNLSSGTTEKAEGSTSLVLKVGRKISAAREKKLRDAADALANAGTVIGDILKELDASESAEETPAPAPAPTVAKSATPGAEAKILEGMQKLFGLMEAQSSIIQKQAARIAAIENERPESNALDVEDSRSSTVEKQEPVWRIDMSSNPSSNISF